MCKFAFLFCFFYFVFAITVKTLVRVGIEAVVRFESERVNAKNGKDKYGIDFSQEQLISTAKVRNRS